MSETTILEIARTAAGKCRGGNGSAAIKQRTGVIASAIRQAHGLPEPAPTLRGITPSQKHTLRIALQSLIENCRAAGNKAGVRLAEQHAAELGLGQEEPNATTKSA